MALQLPGIIVRIVNDTGIVAPPLYERYPVYIGEGDPYKLISNQRVVRSAGVVDNLVSGSTINEIVSVGDLPGVAKYVDGTDYTLVTGNKISWNPAGSEPTVGNNYYVTFTETRAASAYVPTLYFNENLIYEDHGNKTRTNGNINDVSVGGYLGLQAGSTGVIIAQLDLSSATDPDSPTGQELENAFTAMVDELEKITGYKLFLVPMSSGTLNTTSAANIMFNHAVLASEPTQKQERTVIASLPQSTAYTDAAAFALSYAHSRMVVPFPYNGISKVNGFTSNYDSRFYSAALAGKICSVGIGINISDEIIPNVTVTDNYSPEVETWLVGRGVGPARIKGEVLRNVFIGTTDTTSALTEDLGVQDVGDYVKKYLREQLWVLYRNKPINEDLLTSVDGSVTNILKYLIKEVVIADYKNVSVTQDSTEPRKINVTASVQPAFGMQYMDITFTFVLSFSS